MPETQYSLTGTSPTAIIITATPRTYVLHADSGNSAIIKISNEIGMLAFEEMIAGATMALENFVGSAFALVVSGTQKLHVVWTTQTPGAQVAYKA